MPKKILIVEDEANIRELLRLYLEREGYTVIEAENGVEGIKQWKSEKPDMILLDVMMPVMDGWTVCKEIRAESDVPIIMITAKGETADRVSGLEMGADDYIVKPLEMPEVIARVRAVFRRMAPDDAPEKLSFDNLVIDKQAYDLVIKGKRVDAPPKEIELLYYLASSPNRVFTARSCWTTCGALTTSATPARWTCTSSACAKSSRAYRINGSSRPSGALAINLKPRSKAAWADAVFSLRIMSRIWC